MSCSAKLGGTVTWLSISYALIQNSDWWEDNSASSSLTVWNKPRLKTRGTVYVHVLLESNLRCPPTAIKNQDVGKNTITFPLYFFLQFASQGNHLPRQWSFVRQCCIDPWNIVYNYIKMFFIGICVILLNDSRFFINSLILMAVGE